MSIDPNLYANQANARVLPADVSAADLRRATDERRGTTTNAELERLTGVADVTAVVGSFEAGIEAMKRSQLEAMERVAARAAEFMEKGSAYPEKGQPRVDPVPAFGGSWPTCQHGTPGNKECDACHEEYMAEQDAKERAMLRDEFAGRALAAMISCSDLPVPLEKFDKVAGLAYRWADSMLRARDVLPARDAT